MRDAHPDRVGDRVADGTGDRPLGNLARAGLGFTGRVGGYPHPGQGDLEFLGGHLRQRGPDALAVLHLADPDRDLAVPPEIQPPGQHRVGREVGRERGHTGRHGRPDGKRAR